MAKHKHLTLSDRNDIQLGLKRGEIFKAIGQSILKDPTTVSKEVKRNRQVRESTCDNLPCHLLDKAPFVCNGYPKRRQNCGYQKIFYLAKQAQKNTNKLLSRLVKELLSILKLSGTWIKSFLRELKRDCILTNAISTKKLKNVRRFYLPKVDRFSLNVRLMWKLSLGRYCELYLE